MLEKTYSDVEWMNPILFWLICSVLTIKISSHIYNLSISIFFEHSFKIYFLFINLIFFSSFKYAIHFTLYVASRFQ